MKKFISLAIVLLVAAVAVNVSAQEASLLVGKWSVDPNTLNMDNAAVGDMSLTIEFDEDGEAEIEAVAKGEFPIDEYTNICMTLELDVDLTWTLNGNTLSLLPTGIDIDVENLSVKPYNAMYAEILGMLEAELEAQFRNGSDDMAQSFAAEDSEIILLNDTTLKYRVNNGNVVVCTRML